MQTPLTTRFFEAGQAYRLCHFAVMEGEEWSPPAGSCVVFVEPIMASADGQPEFIDGMYLWALVPSTKMAELIEESIHEQQ